MNKPNRELAAPNTLDELVEKLTTAWSILGCEFDDNEPTKFKQAWGKNDRLPNSSLIALIRDQVPVREFPHWRQPIIDLVNNSPDAVIEAHTRTVFSALSFFLDAGALYCIPALRQELLKPYNLPGPVPRDIEEVQGIAAAVADNGDVELQAHALKLITRDSYGRVQAAQRDSILLTLLTQVEAEAMAFPTGEFDDANYGSEAAQQFCSTLEDPALISYLFEHAGQELHYALFNRVNTVAQQLAGDDTTETSAAVMDFWQQLAPHLQRYAETYSRIGTSSCNALLIKALWNSDSDQAKDLALARTLAQIRRHQSDQNANIEHLANMLNEDSSTIGEQAKEELQDIDDINTLHRLWQLQQEELNSAIFSAIAYRAKQNADDVEVYISENASQITEQKQREQLKSLIDSGFSNIGAKLAKIKPAELATLIPYLDTDAVAQAALPHLQVLAAKSKPLREKLGQALSKISPEIFCDWLKDRRKGVRETALEGLLLCEHDQAQTVLEQALDDAKISDADKDRIHTKLGSFSEHADFAVEQADNSLEALRSKAAQTKIKPQITKLWSPALDGSLTLSDSFTLNDLPTLNDLFAPLDEQVAQWLLTMCMESKDSELPQTVTNALQHLPRERQAQLVDYLVHYWLVQNGDNKLRWLLKFVPVYGDDRIVEPLLKGFQTWFRRAKPKAIFVLETLGKLDTNYALSQVQQVYGRNTYSYTLQEGAYDTLQAAAQKRELDLLDLFDEITPDFGLTQEGLRLDTGGNQYLVTIGADLSLSVKDLHSGLQTDLQTGTPTKSLPSAKDNDDPDLYASATSQFKLLSSHLKKVAEQQSQRLYDAMIAERRWSLARWQLLFQQHPLLGLLCQSLIWSTAEGESFRINDKHRPINAASEEVVLKDSDQIRLWHPATAIDGTVEQAAWCQHVKNEALNPLFDQLGQLTVELSVAEENATQLQRFTGIKIKQTMLRHLLDQWNYSPYDGDGSWIASFALRFPYSRIQVTLNLEDMESFASYDGQTTIIQSFVFSEGNQVLKLAEVPLPIMATVLQHGVNIKAQASANESTN